MIRTVNENKASAHRQTALKYEFDVPICNNCGAVGTHCWKGVYLCTACFWDKKASLLEGEQVDAP